MPGNEGGGVLEGRAGGSNRSTRDGFKDNIRSFSKERHQIKKTLTIELRQLSQGSEGMFRPARKG